MLPGGLVVVVVPIGKARYRVIANRSKALDLVLGGIAVDRLRREADFDISVRQVPSYRRGAVFLAGDAAHCHSPVGGRGRILGIADAVSFARRLSADDLDGYSATRRSCRSASPAWCSMFDSAIPAVFDLRCAASLALGRAADALEVKTRRSETQVGRPRQRLSIAVGRQGRRGKGRRGKGRRFARILLRAKLDFSGSVVRSWVPRIQTLYQIVLTSDT